eukprot:983134-Pelagomonas_calceolata.AAC.2
MLSLFAGVSTEAKRAAADTILDAAQSDPERRGQHFSGEEHLPQPPSGLKRAGGQASDKRRLQRRPCALRKGSLTRKLARVSPEALRPHPGTASLGGG